MDSCRFGIQDLPLINKETQNNINYLRRFYPVTSIKSIILGKWINNVIRYPISKFCYSTSYLNIS
jgi:hypothetical protein